MSMARTLAVPTVVLLAASLLSLLLPARAQAQTDTDAQGAEKAQTLTRLLDRVTVDLKDQRVGDVLEFLQTVAGVRFEVVTADDSDEGIDLDASVTFAVRNQTVLEAVERLFVQAERAQGLELGTMGWQFASYGGFVIGPKSALNQDRRVVIYDIQDLLFEVRDFDELPDIQIDEDAQNPFQQEEEEDEDQPTKEELAQEIIDIITSSVEAAQWEETGGEGATIRYFRGTLIINAPDYIHRQVNGYEWWGGQASRVAASEQRAAGVAFSRPRQPFERAIRFGTFSADEPLTAGAVRTKLDEHTARMEAERAEREAQVSERVASRPIEIPTAPAGPRDPTRPLPPR